MAPASAFGVRTFVWHADFVDTYVRPILTARAGARAAEAAAMPLWAWARAIAERCDATFVASRAVATKLQEVHRFPRVVLLPFGVDRAYFRPDAADASTRRTILGSHPQAALLVGMGRFAVEKRWDVVVDAVREVGRSKDVVLALLGDGPERAAIERRARGLPVRFLGFERDRSAVARVLASADLLVHACAHETFGFAIAEALCCGLPVVVPDGGGARDFAEPGASERFRAGDRYDAARAVARMLARLESGADIIRDAAARAGSTVPSTSSYVAEAYAVYDALLAGRAPRAALRAETWSPRR
jgi:alpha-1,6-mannosyltransferase